MEDLLNEANRTHFLGKRSQLRTRWQSWTKRRSGFLFSYLRVAEQPIPKNSRLTKRTQLRTALVVVAAGLLSVDARRLEALGLTIS